MRCAECANSDDGHLQMRLQMQQTNDENLLDFNHIAFEKLLNAGESNAERTIFI